MDYRVLNPFNDHKAGEVIPAEVIEGWPSGALENRLSFKDIELAVAVPAALPEVLGTGDSGTNTSEESEDSEDTEEEQDEPSDDEDSVGEETSKKPDTATMSKKDIVAFVAEHFDIDIPTSWTRAEALAKLEELTAEWPS